MTIEAATSLWAAVRAKSPALLAFGGDSAIELLSAGVVLWRFQRPASEESAERRAARITGILLLVLAVYVAGVSALTMLGYSEPKPSRLGIAILALAAIAMPWLAREKRRLSSVTGSAALRADAAESMLCAYLSLIALVGLAASAFFGIGWADPVAALAITPLIVWEAREALQGKPCSCG
jgi:divalent metal cation (Fe/Co/Zn/Cd) transporter